MHRHVFVCLLYRQARRAIQWVSSSFWTNSWTQIPWLKAENFAKGLSETVLILSNFGLPKMSHLYGSLMTSDECSNADTDGAKRSYNVPVGGILVDNDYSLFSLLKLVTDVHTLMAFSMRICYGLHTLRRSLFAVWKRRIVRPPHRS
jgi:hypothetical protein